MSFSQAPQTPGLCLWVLFLFWSVSFGFSVSPTSHFLPPASIPGPLDPVLLPVPGLWEPSGESARIGNEGFASDQPQGILYETNRELAMWGLQDLEGHQACSEGPQGQRERLNVLCTLKTEETEEDNETAKKALEGEFPEAASKPGGWGGGYFPKPRRGAVPARGQNTGLPRDQGACVYQLHAHPGYGLPQTLRPSPDLARLS